MQLKVPSWLDIALKEMWEQLNAVLHKTMCCCFLGQSCTLLKPEPFKPWMSSRKTTKYASRCAGHGHQSTCNQQVQGDAQATDITQPLVPGASQHLNAAAFRGESTAIHKTHNSHQHARQQGGRANTITSRPGQPTTLSCHLKTLRQVSVRPLSCTRPRFGPKFEFERKV